MATLAATGCKHTPPPVTKFHEAPLVGNPSTPPPDYSTKPFNSGDTGIKPEPYTGGPLATTTNWNPHDMIQHPEKLAQYTVHFKYDSAVVEDSEQANLAAVSDALKSDLTAKLLIAGHCDERGTEEYNRSLGERRALALREALAKIGVAADRIGTISFGKDQPVDTGHNEAAWAKNRRGQFIWCTPKTAAP
jgi:peptidoglycan-associated lipoprotein